MSTTSLPGVVRFSSSRCASTSTVGSDESGVDGLVAGVMTFVGDGAVDCDGVLPAAGTRDGASEADVAEVGVAGMLDEVTPVQSATRSAATTSPISCRMVPN